MSRIGKKPVAIPAGVEAKIGDGMITITGPKGTLTQPIHPKMKVEINDGVITVSRPNDLKENRALHGLTRSLISNMVEGVTNGYKKDLEVNGVGYRVQKQGSNLVLNLGYSHQVIVPEVEGIKFEAQTRFLLSELTNKKLVKSLLKSEKNVLRNLIKEKALNMLMRLLGAKRVKQVRNS